MPGSCLISHWHVGHHPSLSSRPCLCQHAILITKTGKNCEGSETSPYLQTNKLVWHCFGDAVRATAKVLFSSSGPRSQFPQDNAKNWVILVHTESSSTGEEPWTQGTQFFSSALCSRRRNSLFCSEQTCRFSWDGTLSLLYILHHSNFIEKYSGVKAVISTLARHTET